MRQLFTYISAVLIIFLLALSANVAHASTLCKDELKPYIKTLRSYNGTRLSRNDLIKVYHSKRQAIYTMCDKPTIRKFEASFRKKVKKSDETRLEVQHYFPEKRKTVEIGEIDPLLRHPSSGRPYNPFQ